MSMDRLSFDLVEKMHYLLSEWLRRAPVCNRKNEDDAEDVVDGELLNLQQTTSCQHFTHLTLRDHFPSAGASLTPRFGFLF
ncbi:hypothetical protein ACFX11_025888 [Malus domestica]